MAEIQSLQLKILKNERDLKLINSQLRKLEIERDEIYRQSHNLKHQLKRGRV